MSTVPGRARTSRPATTSPLSKPRRSRRAGAGRRGGRGARAPWWFLLPALAFYAFVVLIPSVRGGYFAFTNWDGLSKKVHFTGLKNLRDIFSDDVAYSSLQHTLLIAGSIMVIQNLIGLGLALGVHTHIKSRNALRMFLFAPAVLTPVVTGFLWKNLLSPDGAINSIITTFHLGATRDWLGNSTLALWSIIGVIVWQFSGYSMVIFLAGMQSIPAEVVEAAKVDGAGPVRRFWSITRPLLAPAITINLMLSLIGGIKLFDQVFAMTAGGPGNATDTLSTLIYKDAFALGEFGYSAMIAVGLTVIVIVLAGIQFRVLRRRELDVS